MHTLYVHSSGASVTVSVTMLPVAPAIWKVEFSNFPLNLDWPQWIIWRGECVPSGFLQLLRLSHQGFCSDPFPLWEISCKSARRSHPWRDHCGSSCLCRRSGAWASIQLTTGILSCTKCHPSPGARHANEEAILYGDVPVSVTQAMCPGELFLRNWCSEEGGWEH